MVEPLVAQVSTEYTVETLYASGLPKKHCALLAADGGDLECQCCTALGRFLRDPLFMRVLAVPYWSFCATIDYCCCNAIGIFGSNDTLVVSYWCTTGSIDTLMVSFQCTPLA